MELLGQPVGDDRRHDVDRDDDRADVNVGPHQLGPQLDQQDAEDCPEDDPTKEDVDKDPQAVAKREVTGLVGRQSEVEEDNSGGVVEE